MNHPLRKGFTEWADANGVSLEDEGDWGAWWGCYLAGSIAGVQASITSQFSPLQHEVEHLKKVADKLTGEAKSKDRAQSEKVESSNERVGNQEFGNMFEKVVCDRCGREYIGVVGSAHIPCVYNGIAQPATIKSSQGRQSRCKKKKA